MASVTQARREQVLRAIVADYIQFQEPVGSKALLERHKLNVSSATIRNDMAVLESEGHITQQHASSGRIPTEKGYRAFVDSLPAVKPMSGAEKRAILTFLDEGVDLDDVLRRSVQLLAQFTRQAAVIQVPTLSVAKVKHCEVVALTSQRLLLVLITDSGRVDQRNVELAAPINEEGVAGLRDLLNNALQGATLGDAAVRLTELPDSAPPELKPHVVAAATTLLETFIDHPTDRLIVAGTSNLSRVPGADSQALTRLIEAMEEQVVLLKLMSDLPDLGDVSVSIGQEHHTEALHTAAIVTSSYGSGDIPLGGLSVVGPTYMDYPGTIAKVATVARYVGRILSGE